MSCNNQLTLKQYSRNEYELSKTIVGSSYSGQINILLYRIALKSIRRQEKEAYKNAIKKTEFITSNGLLSVTFRHKEISFKKKLSFYSHLKTTVFIESYKIKTTNI